MDIVLHMIFCKVKLKTPHSSLPPLHAIRKCYRAPVLCAVSNAVPAEVLVIIEGLGHYYRFGCRRDCETWCSSMFVFSDGSQ